MNDSHPTWIQRFKSLCSWRCGPRIRTDSRTQPSLIVPNLDEFERSALQPNLSNRRMKPSRKRWRDVLPNSRAESTSRIPTGTDQEEAMEPIEPAIPVVTSIRIPAVTTTRTTIRRRTRILTKIRPRTRISTRDRVRRRTPTNIRARVRVRTRIQTVSDVVPLRIGLVSARWRERTYEHRAMIRDDLQLRNHSEMFDL